MTDSSGIHINIGFVGALGLIFITLKLLHQISWSWVWVLSPLWIPIAIAGVIGLGALLVIGVINLYWWIKGY
jgi:hypothetical protein